MSEIKEQVRGMTPRSMLNITGHQYISKMLKMFWTKQTVKCLNDSLRQDGRSIMYRSLLVQTSAGKSLVQPVDRWLSVWYRHYEWKLYTLYSYRWNEPFKKNTINLCSVTALIVLYGLIGIFYSQLCVKFARVGKIH